MAIDLNKDYSKLRGSTELHNELKNKFTVMVNKTFHDVVIIPYDVGFFRAWSNPEIPVRCGREGVPDLIVFTSNGYLFFDAKTGKNKLQENQLNFSSEIEKVTGENRVYKLSIIAEGLNIIREFKK